MKMRLKVQRASVDGIQEVGDIVDVSEAEAQRMLEAGHAERVSEKRRTTNRRTKQVETTSRRTGEQR